MSAWSNETLQEMAVLDYVSPEQCTATVFVSRCDDVHWPRLRLSTRLFASTCKGAPLRPVQVPFGVPFRDAAQRIARSLVQGDPARTANYHGRSCSLQAHLELHQ